MLCILRCVDRALSTKSPDRSLNNPGSESKKPALATRLITCDIPVSKQGSTKYPCATQPSRELWMIQPRHQHCQHRLGHILDQVAVRSLGTIELIRCPRSGGLLRCGTVVWVRDLRRGAKVRDYLGLEERIYWNDAKENK